jgi:hypothetical protein
VPDYATVKRLALGTPPINTCEGTKEAKQVTPPGAEDQAQLAPGSMALSCAHVAAPLVRYLIFNTEADRDKEIRDLMLESGSSPFFVNGRTLVHVDAADPTKPSPLAARIKDKCGCGVVHEAGAH